MDTKSRCSKSWYLPCTWSSWECGVTIMTHTHRQLVALFLGVAEETINETMRKQWNERHGR